MSFGSIPPIDQSLLPASVRNGTTAEKQAYTTALGFEQMLVDQLSQELASTSQPDSSSDSGSSESDSSLLGGSDAATNTYAQLLPAALTSGVMSAGGLGIAQQLASALAPTQSSPAATSAVSSAAPSGGAAPAASSAASTGGAAPVATSAASAAATSPAASSVASASPSESSESSESSERPSRGVRVMSTAVSIPDADALLTGDVLAHLETQLTSARRLLQIILKQGEAIRERNVQSVVALTGMIQAEMQRRTLLEDERSHLLDRAGARLGITPGAVTLTLLATLMPEPSAQEALERSWELRGLLTELQREHTVNRALMHQELAFLDHLLRLADGRVDAGYDSVGERPTGTPSLGANRRMFDLQA